MDGCELERRRELRQTKIVALLYLAASLNAIAFAIAVLALVCAWAGR